METPDTERVISTRASRDPLMKSGDRVEPVNLQAGRIQPRRIIQISCALVALALGLVFIRRLVDFPVYYAAGQSLLAGRTDFYSADFASGALMDYRYPPFFLLLFSPFWLLPYIVSAYIWYVLGISGIAAAGLSIQKTLTPPDLPRENSANAEPRVDKPRRGTTVFVWTIGALLAAPYFVMILHYGNAHLIAISLTFVSLYLAIKGKNTPAAVLMALAITIKLVPALLIPYFVLKRRWRFSLLVGAFLILFNLAPAAYLGVRTNNDLLATWYRHVLVDQEFHEINGPINLSLKGQLRRYLTRVDYSQRVDGDTGYPEINIASVSESQADRLWLALSCFLYLAGLVWIWLTARWPGAGDPGAASRQALELALVICLMLLVGPLTSKIYFIGLLWPAVFVAYLAKSEGRTGCCYVLAGITGLSALLPLLPGRHLQRLLLVLGMDFYLTLTLLLMAVWLLAARASVAGEESQSQGPPETRTP